MENQRKDGNNRKQKRGEKKSKKHNVEETDNSLNRHSRLNDMVGETSEVTQLLSAVVKQ